MTQVWDQSVKDRVCKMYLDGLSNSQIAKIISLEGRAMTRNAAIGIVNRAHLTEKRASKPAHTNGGYGPGKRKPVPVTLPPLSVEPQQMLVAKLPAAMEEAIQAGGALVVTMENVSNLTCRYPIGDVGAADFHFCGVTPKPGRPYCLAHEKLCHQPFHHGATISPEDRKLVADMARKSGSQRAFG